MDITTGWSSYGAAVRARRPGRASRLAAAAAAPALAEPVEGRRLLSAGDLDPTFGTAGATSVGFSHGRFDGSVALDDANRKTMVAGGF